jgi:hypothetical protein
MATAAQTITVVSAAESADATCASGRQTSVPVAGSVRICAHAEHLLQQRKQQRE